MGQQYDSAFLLLNARDVTLHAFIRLPSNLSADRLKGNDKLCLYKKDFVTVPKNGPNAIIQFRLSNSARLIKLS